VTGEAAPGPVDLAAKRLGGMALAASDEFFAAKESLLEPAAPRFMPGRFTDRGKWMDGWETRRRRGPGHDWCLVRLGVPGVVRAVVVDTTHFQGNQPAACSLDGLAADPAAPLDELLDPAAGWLELLGRTELAGDREQRFPVAAPARVSHVRLNIHPDGGVARLRVHGEPLPDLRALAGHAGATLDLAAATAGGQVVGCSDMRFGSAGNLVLPGDAVDMGDGWETRRRRGPGHDWAVVRLAAEAVVDRVEVDTTHYKGNHPDSCTVEAGLAPDTGVPEAGWRTLVPSSRLGPHARHGFAVTGPEPATHVRLAIHPDGGVSRLRVWGRVTDQGWAGWGVRWLNALPARQAEAELLACCGARAWAAGVAAARPFADPGGLAAAADRVWEGLGRDDWLEAFAAHPRIGERGGGSGGLKPSPPESKGPGWSAGEQAGVGGAEAGLLAALADGNREYEERFGHVFLVCATGRDADELLAALKARIGNDPATELSVAAAEQAKITRLRLQKLLRP
jgi:allantoicase